MNVLKISRNLDVTNMQWVERSKIQSDAHLFYLTILEVYCLGFGQEITDQFFAGDECVCEFIVDNYCIVL